MSDKAGARDRWTDSVPNQAGQQIGRAQCGAKGQSRRLRLKAVYLEVGADRLDLAVHILSGLLEENLRQEVGAKDENCA